ATRRDERAPNRVLIFCSDALKHFGACDQGVKTQRVRSAINHSTRREQTDGNDPQEREGR
ncbi:MAG TPA: hypothetical protein VGD87_12760, partial [Archangium sp.]